MHSSTYFISCLWLLTLGHCLATDVTFQSFNLAVNAPNWCFDFVTLTPLPFINELQLSCNVAFLKCGGGTGLKAYECKGTQPSPTVTLSQPVSIQNMGASLADPGTGSCFTNSSSPFFTLNPVNILDSTECPTWDIFLGNGRGATWQVDRKNGVFSGILFGKERAIFTLDAAGDPQCERCSLRLDERKRLNKE